MSDTLDNRGPIPLTRACLRVKPRVVDVCCVDLGASRRVAHTVRQVEALRSLGASKSRDNSVDNGTPISEQRRSSMANPDGNHNWLTLYKEAVFEPDRAKVKGRVAQALAAIRLRARELWYAGATGTSERHQLDAASHSLGLLHAFGADRRVLRQESRLSDED